MESKTTTVSAAVAPSERARLFEYARKCGVPLSELMRRHSLDDLLTMAQGGTVDPAPAK